MCAAKRLNDVQRELELAQETIFAMKQNEARHRCELQEVVESTRLLQSSASETVSQLRSEVTSMRDEMMSMTSQQESAFNLMAQQVSDAIGKIESSKRHMQTMYEKERDHRKKLHNQLIELQGNIRVICRVRPISASEQKDGEEAAVLIQSSTNLKVQQKSFEFDQVCGPDSTQVSVYSHVAPFVQSAIDGYNVCIFACT